MGDVLPTSTSSIPQLDPLGDVQHHTKEPIEVLGRPSSKDEIQRGISPESLTQCIVFDTMAEVLPTPTSTLPQINHLYDVQDKTTLTKEFGITCIAVNKIIDENKKDNSSSLNKIVLDEKMYDNLPTSTSMLPQLDILCNMPVQTGNITEVFTKTEKTVEENKEVRTPNWPNEIEFTEKKGGDVTTQTSRQPKLDQSCDIPVSTRQLTEVLRASDKVVGEEIKSTNAVQKAEQKQSPDKTFPSGTSNGMSASKETHEDLIPELITKIEVLYDRESSAQESGSDYTEIPSEPGEPIEVDSSSNSITLAWSAPKRGVKSIDSYELKYKECNRKVSKWIPFVTENSRRTVEVPDLKCGTDYEFKIRAVNEDGEEGPFSPVSKMSTKLSLAKTIQLNAKKIKNSTPCIFKLPLLIKKETTNHVSKTRKCTFGKKKGTGVEKTIMLVGATGSGKSTLIDGMINYITDVSWEDDFRFSLVDLTDDEKDRHKNQTESQTEWITCYTIHKIDGSKINYDLNIIDTPGFGDTRGIIRDKAIVNQIREFFTTPGDQGITFLDAVCFVTQAPLARLTPPQRYIFDAILSVFGQDIASNIYVLMTFADGNEPPVREALRSANVPFESSFKFNNSALFASSGKSDEAKFGNLFWKMGQESFRVFFEELRFVESKSLQLTNEVLQLRKNLEATIQGLQPQIAEGMNQLNTIRQEKEVLMRHKTDIEANSNFVYEVDEIRMTQIDLPPSKYVTNCLTCNRTCHFPCRIPDDNNKRRCSAMKGGYCTVCPKKCFWDMHRNNTFRFETFSVKVKKTYDELKRKYETAQQEEQKQRSVIGKVRGAFTALGNQVMKMVRDVRGYINKLNEIALRPNPLSDLDYIDLLIESEKTEKRYGCEQRLRLFYRMREEAELVAKTSKPNYKPWGDDDDILNDEK